MPLARGASEGPGARVRVAVRTNSDVALADETDANATVVRIPDFFGERFQLEAAIDEGPTVRAHVPRHATIRSIEKGTRVRVEARAQRVYSICR